MRAGHYLDARLCCEQALALDSDKPESLHLMGLVCVHARRYDHAVEWTSRAIRKDPKPAYLTTLGNALLAQGRREEAVAVFDKAVQLKPDDATLWCNMGNALLDAGRSSDALLCFEHVVKLDPCHREATYKAGHLLHGLGQFEEALIRLNSSAELQPDHAPTLHMRAITLKSLDRLDEALADSMRAIELDPTNIDVYGNIGDILQARGLHEEALSWYERSLEIRPDAAKTMTSRAVSLVDLCRFDEAMAAYRRSLILDPNQSIAVWNLSLLQMLTGDFQAGWRGREARFAVLPELAANYPRWSAKRLGNEAVAGKTVIVCADEGLGDSIQFVRYVPMLAARGARVILIVEEPLVPILSGMKGISQCLPKLPDTVAPPFDFLEPIGSLPLVFGTTLDSIPSERTYLPCPEMNRVQAWEDRLGPREKLMVGLVWSGNPKHRGDRNRSMPLRTLTRILDVDATFVSLQKSPRPEDVLTLRESTDIIDLTSDLTDFAETAALVACLDLVITVDTSVAHLSAALGCPTWILLPHVPDYRWLLDREDSPWYPTVRLFRQTETREYETVLDRVRAELVTLIGAKS
jgi:tetratricopeptide (TPR) repeat protein